MKFIFPLVTLATMSSAYANEPGYFDYDRYPTSSKDVHLHLLNAAGLDQKFEVVAPWPESPLWQSRDIQEVVNGIELQVEYNDPFTSNLRKSEIEETAEQFLDDLNQSDKYILNEIVVRSSCPLSNLDPDTRSVWIDYPDAPKISTEHFSRFIVHRDTGFRIDRSLDYEKQYDFNLSFSFSSREEYNEFLEEFSWDTGNARTNGPIKCVVTYEPLGIVESTDQTYGSDYSLAIKPVNVKLFSTVDGVMLVDWDYESD